MSHNQVLASRLSKLYTVRYTYETGLLTTARAERVYRSRERAVLDVRDLLGNILVTEVIVSDDFGHQKQFVRKPLTADEDTIRRELLKHDEVVSAVGTPYGVDGLPLNVRYWLTVRPSLKARRDVEAIAEEIGYCPSPDSFSGDERKKVAAHLRKEIESNAQSNQ